MLGRDPYYDDVDMLFVKLVISDAMRRGVRHFTLGGIPLTRLTDVMNVLEAGDDIMMDAAGSQEPPRQ